VFTPLDGIEETSTLIVLVVEIYYISISTRRPKPSDVNGLLNIKMFRYRYNIIVCVKI